MAISHYAGIQCSQVSVSSARLVKPNVQQPVGQYVSNASALPHTILVQIIVIHKGEIEAAIGANISGVVAWFKPGESTSSPTVRTAEPDPITWKWIAIGAIGGGVVLVIVVIIVWRW